MAEETETRRTSRTGAAGLVAAIPLALGLSLSGLEGGSDGEPTRGVRRAEFTTVRATELTGEDLRLAEENCPFGLPALDPEWDHGPTVHVAREGYMLEHSSVDKIPLWVCEHVKRSELRGTAERKNKFAADPKLEGKPRAELRDYRGSGFDRGHQAPAGNQKRSQRLKDETFFLSNMAPQVGRRFNQSIWRELEELTRDWVADEVVDSAFIVTGGFFYDPDEENPETADGFVEFETIGPGNVSVPTHFYKLVISGAAGRNARAVAFVMENRNHSRPFVFEDSIESIDWIEERTGIDFMPGLSASLEEQLERRPGRLFR